MRDADPGELQILYNPADRSSGKTYLAKRLDQSPRQKYYFPEATSWRIGWIQNQWCNVKKILFYKNGMVSLDQKQFFFSGRIRFV